MKIEFIASLSDTQSAITIGGDGATRVRFDIPESEIAEAVKLVMLKGTAFKVSIETTEANKKMELKRWQGIQGCKGEKQNPQQ